MSKSWPVKKLREVADIIGGYAFKSNELKDFKVSDNYLPIIKIGNLSSDGNLVLENIQYHKFQENLAKFLIKVNDILVAMTGATTGKVAISNKNNLLLNQRVGVIRPREKIVDANYLKHYLLSGSFYKYCQITAGGGAQGNISPSQIMKYTILLPPLKIQKKIAERLDTIMKARELIDLQIKKTEELFNSISYLTFKTGDGHKLGELFVRQTKTTLPITEPDHDFNFIGLENIASNKGELINLDKTKGENIKSNKFIFKKEDILYGKLRPYLNKVWLADFDGICSTDIWVLRANKKLIRPVMLAALLRSKLVVDKMSSVMTGTSLPRANATSFDNLQVKLPAMNEQYKIVERLDAIQEYKKLLQNQKQLYKELFDSVLDKSMKGEIN